MLLLVFFISCSVIGFYLPYFLDNFSIFKIKGLILYEASINKDLIVGNIKNNCLFIDEAHIENKLKNLTNNYVEKVYIKRVFKKYSVYLEVYIKEREPFLKVIENDRVFYYDERGEEFIYNINKDLPILYTHDKNKDLLIFKN